MAKRVPAKNRSPRFVGFLLMAIPGLVACGILHTLMDAAMGLGGPGSSAVDLIAMGFLVLMLGGLGFVFWIGWRCFRGTWGQKSRPGGCQVPALNWEQNPLFPRSAKGRRGPRGGVAMRPETTALKGFVTLLLAAICWNVISWVAWFGVLSERGSLASKWLPLAIIGLFVVVGVFIAGATIYQFFRLVLVGTPLAEVDIEPLAPGQSTRLRIYQPGDFPIGSAVLHLLLREEVRYVQGSDVVRQKEDVFCEKLAELGTCRALGKTPLIDVMVSLPDWAPHSFQSKNNILQWCLRLEMEIPNRPNVDDLFFLRVKPESCSRNGGRR